MYRKNSDSLIVIKGMSQEPAFKNFNRNSNQSASDFGSGIPRSLPQKRSVRASNLSIHSAYAHQNSVVLPKANVQGIQAMDASNMAELPLISINPQLVQKQTRRPHDPILQGNLINHPAYTGGFVDVVAPEPKFRAAPLKSNIYERQMFEARKQDQLIRQDDIKTTPGIPGPLIKPFIKQNERQKITKEDHAVDAHFKKEPRLIDVHGVVGREAIQAFSVEPQMFEQSAIFKDVRLEKRKEQQEAYRQRRDAERQKMDELYNQVNQIRNQK